MKDASMARRVVTVLARGILALAIPAQAAFYELAQSNLGATVSANETNASYSCHPQFCIDGKVQSTHIGATYWSVRTTAWLRVNLPAAYVTNMIFTNVVLRDRQNGAERDAPFEIKIYDASDGVLETFNYTSTVCAASYTLTNTTSTTGASYLVYRHTGTNGTDMFIAEVQAVFAGDYWVNLVGFGTNSLVGLLEGGADCGELANVQAVRFVQNDKNSQWLEITEIEATNAAGTDVSTTGIYYGNGDGSSPNAAAIVNSVTGETGCCMAPAWPRFGGYPPGDTDKHYIGVTNPPATIIGVRYCERDINRTPSSIQTYSNLQLEVFSDAATLTNLLYSRRVAPGHHPGAWQDFKFLTGGVVRARMDAGETYRFKISGTTKNCDVLNVYQKSGSQTCLDFNGASLRVVLNDGVLSAGDSFQLFKADQYTGSLSVITLPVLSSGNWATSQLLTQGTISVNIPQAGTFFLME